MELNKVIKLKEGKLFDLSDVKMQQRVVYIKDSDSVVVVYSQRVAPQIRIMYGDSAVLMTASQAATMYPEKFTFTKYEKGSRVTFNKAFMIYLNANQADFVKSKGIASSFIRSLIDKAMERENYVGGE
ncbi:hypothetical protein [Prevotella sp. P2-180]|uniref:hypothetical protein n=1 Tax=Prevotella sp. P2-180 TaxID=2024224 RepID=UPI000B97815C|nr:hypothetical protein [Prevotella sp. P2-180]OYP67003.1 hypothetical protein CIK98_06290 [Prevotella sp. P2-180]